MTHSTYIYMPHRHLKFNAFISELQIIFYPKLAFSSAFPAPGSCSINFISSKHGSLLGPSSPLSTQLQMLLFIFPILLKPIHFSLLLPSPSHSRSPSTLTS